MEINLDGKVAIVTGASRGIGLETALTFARSGASGVVITSRKPENLEAAMAQLAEAGVEQSLLLPLPARADSADAAEEAVAATIDRFGALLTSSSTTQQRIRPPARSWT